MKSITVALSLLLLINSPKEIFSGRDKDVCLTEEEQHLYALIMDYRKSNNLTAIPLSNKLTRVAKAHAEDLSENYNFDPANRCNPHSWSKKGKWSSCCYTNDHKEASCMWSKPKEIADYAANGYEIAYYSSIGASAQEGLDGWKISPGHNPLLINSGIWNKVKWNAIGIAIHKNYGLVWFGELADDTQIKNCD
jgi:uncharacterized protein YkwD